MATMEATVWHVSIQVSTLGEKSSLSADYRVIGREH